MDRRKRNYNVIDDSSVMGNPFDWTRWKVKRQAGRWVVLDALGNPIFESGTKQEARDWKEKRRPTR